ncbi:hypothetical protein QAD02_012959 [Eretmocerus hayati]|uniref:Uncharacterized protein n=1 Tax=Eretmocerus hayati TaxID=131215 RepID=A0ACC2P410_9HYME|nr:hypothetical protein QAD02_012959 [Eretmocerus hayati]
MESSHNQKKYSLRNVLFPEKVVEERVTDTSTRIENGYMTEDVRKYNVMNHSIDLGNHAPHVTKRKLSPLYVHKLDHEHPAKRPRTILRQEPGDGSEASHVRTPIHPKTITSPNSLQTLTSVTPMYVRDCHNSEKETMKYNVEVVNEEPMNYSVRESLPDANMVSKQYEVDQQNKFPFIDVSRPLDDTVMGSKSTEYSDFMMKRRLYQRNFYLKNRERVLEKKGYPTNVKQMRNSVSHKVFISPKSHTVLQLYPLETLPRLMKLSSLWKRSP